MNGTELLARLVAAFPQQPIDDATLVVMAQELRDLAPHELERAVRDHIRNGRWFPTVAELRERAIEPLAHRPFTALPAWEEVPDPDASSYSTLDRLGLIGKDGRTRGFPNRAFYEAKQRAEDEMSEKLERNRSYRVRRGEEPNA